MLLLLALPPGAATAAAGQLVSRIVRPLWQNIPLRYAYQASGFETSDVDFLQLRPRGGEIASILLLYNHMLWAEKVPCEGCGVRLQSGSSLSTDAAVTVGKFLPCLCRQLQPDLELWSEIRQVFLVSS